MLKWLDWVFLARPIVLIPSWAFLLAGYLRGGEEAGDASLPVGPLVAPGILLTLLLSGIYVINQIYDRETDRANGKLFLLAEGHVPVNGAWVEAAALVLLSLGGALIVRPALLPWLAASALVGLFYSVEPVRMKGRPIADLVANGVGYGGITFLFGFSLAPAGGHPLPRAIPYVLLVGAVFLHTALVDREGDRTARLQTTALLLGDRGTSVAALLLLLLAMLAGLDRGEPYATVASIGAIPFFVWAVLAPGKKRSTLAYQWGSLLFVLLLVIRQPFFGLLLLLLVLATRLYYRFRFHMVYPHLDL